MATVTITLPRQKAQTALNSQRWEELLSNPEMLRRVGRVETDRHGHILFSPPSTADHAILQAEISILLRVLMRIGRIIISCALSTADGVKAADVAWASPQRMRKLGNRVCFPESPEICVEVLSPSNTQAEIEEKTALYFDAGAKEVWICSLSGKMTFLGPAKGEILRRSAVCPEFPQQIELR